jgi:hypothetical protein
VWYNIYVIKRADKLLKTEKRKKNMAMNERTYLNTVLAIENLSDEMREETLGRIAKLDAKNEKRKGVQTKVQKENEPIANAIIEALANGGMLSVDLASAIGQTVNKTNGVAGNLWKEGKLVKTKVKVKGKGEQVQYSLAIEVTADTEESEDTAEE